MSIFSSKSARPVIVAVLILLAVGYFLRGSAKRTRLVTAAITYGSIVRSVTAIDTVNPVITVQVGSYVRWTL